MALTARARVAGAISRPTAATPLRLRPALAAARPLLLLWQPPRAAAGSSSSSSSSSSFPAATMIAVEQQKQPLTTTTTTTTPPPFQPPPPMTAKERAASLRSIERAAQPPAHELAPTYPAAFLARRWLAFAGIFIGYTAFYVTRSSLTYAAPLMVADPTSGVTLSTVGALTSLFPVAYGASKFAAGVLGSRVSARLILSVALTATAAVNLLFGIGGPVPWLCALWALNGVLQGCGAPACASVLTRWYAAKERGTYWGAWSASHNAGGFLAPLIVGAAATGFGWRWGMFAPAVVGAMVGAFVLLAVRDSPAACGFGEDGSAVLAGGGGGGGGKGNESPPSLEEQKQQQQQKEKQRQQPEKQQQADADRRALSASIARAAMGRRPLAARLLAPAAASLQALTTGPVGAVLRNPLVWSLAFTYFFVYVVRQGVASWLMFYLMAEKGVSDAATAAVTVSALELGGLFGGAAAGLVSDHAIKRAGPQAGHVGTRVRVCMVYTAGIALALLALRAVPPAASGVGGAGHPALLALSVAALGFCVYGPQMLVGLAGAELVSPAGVGASQGLLGWIAYMGAANAGVPIASVVERSGWGGFFTAMLAATAVAMLLLSTACNARSYAQRTEEEEEEEEEEEGVVADKAR